LEADAVNAATVTAKTAREAVDFLLRIVEYTDLYALLGTLRFTSAAL